ELVLLGVGVFDVADRALGLRDVVGDALVALGADAGRPFDRGVGTHVRLPFRADLREIVREDEGRAGPVRAVNDRDRVRRQLRLRIELFDRRIVPGLAFAEEDLGERRPVENELTGRNSLEIDTGTTPPITVGNCTSPSLASSSALSGMSEAPKVTVLALICLMPPPDPIDW